MLSGASVFHCVRAIKVAFKNQKTVQDCCHNGHHADSCVHCCLHTRTSLHNGSAAVMQFVSHCTYLAQCVSGCMDTATTLAPSPLALGRISAHFASSKERYEGIAWRAVIANSGTFYGQSRTLQLGSVCCGCTVQSIDEGQAPVS
ncbi:hypothetical protein TRVL_07432 [Trypanosoma vivax]|nr:hypothetical protein TRVL_07432 [Trypanosoma vivax]